MNTKKKSMNIRERKINSSYSNNLMIIVNVTEDEVPLSKRLSSSQYKQKKLVKTDGIGSCLTIKIKTEAFLIGMKNDTYYFG